MNIKKFIQISKDINNNFPDTLIENIYNDIYNKIKKENNTCKKNCIIL
jgi:hypothetical protein